jgi:ribulose 1,5-bisphosphate synthetase/thiazole synthase
MFKGLGTKNLFKNSKKYFSKSFDYDVCIVGGGPAGK